MNIIYHVNTFILNIAIKTRTIPYNMYNDVYTIDFHVDVKEQTFLQKDFEYNA